MQLGEIIDRNKITFMSSVPPVWRLALRTAAPPEAGSLERVFCGSAPLSGTLRENIQAWTGTKSVFNAYGITETGSWLAGSTDSELPAEDGFIGKPWGGVLKVLKGGDTSVPPWAIQECSPGESGYVWVNTPALMRGYLGQDDLTRRVVSNGWFVTGDIGIIDDRGYLYLRGREREEINKGGTKIYPADIDAVAERFNSVTDVCSFPVADPLLGENIGVALVMSASSDTDLLELHQWMKKHLAQHKLPEHWFLLDEIPRTSRGKINRETVAAACQSLTAIPMKQLLLKQS